MADSLYFSQQEKDFFERVIHEGLEAMAACQTFEGLRRLRGKVKLSIDVDQLRD